MSRFGEVLIYDYGRFVLEPLVQAVIDESRHILFTRSEHGSIQAFDLGADGQQPASKVAALSAHEIQHAASLIAQ